MLAVLVSLTLTVAVNILIVPIVHLPSSISFAFLLPNCPLSLFIHTFHLSRVRKTVLLTLVCTFKGTFNRRELLGVNSLAIDNGFSAMTIATTKVVYLGGSAILNTWQLTFK